MSFGQWFRDFPWTAGIDTVVRGENRNCSGGHNLRSSELSAYVQSLLSGVMAVERP
jgi:hypothetical protein